MIMKILLAFLVLLAVLFLIGFAIDRSIRASGYDGPVSEHFNGKKFLNIKEPSEERPSRDLVRVLSWLFTRDKNEWEERAVAPSVPAERVEGGALVATFINHASVLIQTEGLNIITDPIYSERASPFTFLGPKRYVGPGVAFDDLPPIDVVLISHNHYDHLDLATLARLAARNNPRIFVPLGNKEFAESHGLKNVTELDWWQPDTLSDAVSIESVPAQHFSSRALSDRDTTLWSGYVLKTGHGDIYFAGDTGKGIFVDRIAERYPDGFRLGLLPIGAFKPQWFMSEVHISPDEAFEIQDQLKIKDVIAVHFGTFKLADDRQDEPTQRVEELQREGTGTGSFRALKNGESVRF